MQRIAGHFARFATAKARTDFRADLAKLSVQLAQPVDFLAQARTLAVDLLREDAAAERGGEVFVSELADRATITVRAWAEDEAAAQRLEGELRLRTHERLRAAGVLG